MTLQRWAALLGLAASAAFLVISTRPAIRQGMYRVPTDEDVRLQNAVRISREGPGAFPALFRDYLHDAARRRYYPSPLRVTTIMLDALAVRLGGPTFASLQNLSLVAFLVLLALVLTCLQRIIDGRAAWWTASLLACSPLQLAMAGRALSDSLVSLLMVGCVWLCLFAMTAERSGPLRWLGVSIAYTVALLAKESCLVLIPISFGLMMWQDRQARPLGFWPLCAVSLVPVACWLSAASVFAGGADVMWQTLQTTVASAGSNAYALALGSGPWFRYLLDYLLLSPLTTMGYLAWLGALLACGNEHRHVRAWAAVPWLFLLCAAPMTKNVRYALMLDLPLRLGTVLFLQRICKPGAGHKAVIWMSLAMLGLIASDLSSFLRLFWGGNGIYDPVSIELLQRLEIVPQ